MAIDVLAVPISAAGVEHVFLIVRQICSFLHHRLSSETFKTLMIVRQHEKSTLRFSLPEVADNVEAGRGHVEVKCAFADAD
jgi:hypothetical protein